jgi:hypothetical protein
METEMKKTRLPKTDSIKKLAAFWDSHDLTDFAEELEEITEPVFVRRTAIQVPLETHEVVAVERMAESKGVSREELIRTWVLQHVFRKIRNPKSEIRKKPEIRKTNSKKEQ